MRATSSLIGDTNMDKFTVNIKHKTLLIIVICLVLVSVLLMCMSIDSTDNNTESMQSLNDIIVEDNATIESTIEANNTENIEAQEDTVEVDIGNQPMPASINVDDPYEIIASEIEAMKNKDSFQVYRYFGESDVFTPETVADRLTATLVSFVSSEENEDGSFKVIIHICTLDYNSMNEAIISLKNELEEKNTENVEDSAKMEVAKGVVKGKYDLHYTIPVIVKDGKVVITEQLKQALTGNWYHGINTELQSVECPIK